ncbi:MAG: hypothetical protein H0X66_18185 [Verrucomicrobia bacterium]|nr:hypothetical protein [Verrucomicrobiota bacterium]
MIAELKKNCWILVVATLLAVVGCGKQEPVARVPEDKPKTAEEAKMRREARSLGTKLHAAVRKAEAANLDVDQQHVALEPINNDIEQFIYRRMEKYTNRITSITVSYFQPAIQCVIYVKPEGDEEELKAIKRDADSLVGRIIENLPIVKYLMVKNDGAE